MEEERLWDFCPWCGSEYSITDTCCASCDTQRLKSRRIAPKEPWGKELWKKHPYPDNYVDETLFLQGLRRNVHVVNYEYWDVVVDSSVILGQLTVVALYATLFIFTYTGVLSVPVLISLALGLLLLGFFTRVALDSDPASWTSESLFVNIRSLFLVFFAVWTLSPILRTLTEPLSNDTLLASSATCFTIHLFTQDYAFLAGLSQKFSAPVSLNAAIFGAVIVVSRLSSVAHVFVVVSLAIELFALWPLLSRTIKVRNTFFILVGIGKISFDLNYSGCFNHFVGPPYLGVLLSRCFFIIIHI